MRFIFESRNDCKEKKALLIWYIQTSTQHKHDDTQQLCPQPNCCLRSQMFNWGPLCREGPRIRAQFDHIGLVCVCLLGLQVVWRWVMSWPHCEQLFSILTWTVSCVSFWCVCILIVLPKWNMNVVKVWIKMNNQLVSDELNVGKILGSVVFGCYSAVLWLMAELVRSLSNIIFGGGWDTWKKFDEFHAWQKSASVFNIYFH